MKNFLANKHNVALSAYITDKNPSSITTNGALTIIDNSDPSQHIEGLVPNSYSIFLDNLFLATGYGFSSYSHFDKASYMINTYEGVISYIENEINDLRNKSFNVEYTYVENKIDKVYNSYGWLTSYKQIDVSRKNSYTYTIFLDKIDTPYILDTKLEIIGGKDINGTNANHSTDLTYNYFNVKESVNIQFSFIKNKPFDKENFTEASPELYFNGEEINFDDTINDSNITYIKRSIEAPNINQNQDITFVCKRGDDIIYSYTFVDAIKWRYQVLPFNTEKINALAQLDLNTILGFDNYDFSDEVFQNSINSNNNNVLNSIKEFIHNNEQNMVFLDDNTKIEYLGIGYRIPESGEYNNYFSHDYILVKYNSIKIDFYFNGFKNNNWNYIEFNNDEDTYRLYQSPKRYIGKHIWEIKYNNG